MKTIIIGVLVILILGALWTYVHPYAAIGALVLFIIWALFKGK